MGSGEPCLAEAYEYVIRTFAGMEKAQEKQVKGEQNPSLRSFLFEMYGEQEPPDGAGSEYSPGKVACLGHSLAFQKLS